MIYTDVTGTDEAATTEEAILCEVQRLKEQNSAIIGVLWVIAIMDVLLAVTLVARP